VGVFFGSSLSLPTVEFPDKARDHNAARILVTRTRLTKAILMLIDILIPAPADRRSPAWLLIPFAHHGVTAGAQPAGDCDLGSPN